MGLLPGFAKMAQVAGKMANSMATKIPLMVKGVQGSVTPRLQTFWRYAKVELRPPSLTEMPQVQKGFSDIVNAAKSGKWKNLTVREAAVNTLVGVEVICWFFIGEVLGKLSLIGYYIPGAFDTDPHI